MRGSGNFWADLAAFAIIGAVLFVIRIVWTIFTSGKNDKDNQRGQS
jgi:hypothetical protein